MKPASKLALNKIRTDGGTQSRESLSTDTIGEYTEAYRSKENGMPPVVVFFDGKAHWLADGFHRVAAARAAGCARIDAEVKKGTQRDAVLYSCGTNSTHGLPRTNADKRRAVLVLLGDGEWCKKSDRWIATQCAVGYTLVSEMRRSTARDGQLKTERVGRDGKTRALPSKPAVSGKPANNVTPIRPPPAVRIAPEPERANADAESDAGGAPDAFDPDYEIYRLEMLFSEVSVAWPTTVPLDELWRWLKVKLGMTQEKMKTWPTKNASAGL